MFLSSLSGLQITLVVRIVYIFVTELIVSFIRTHSHQYKRFIVVGIVEKQQRV